MTTDGIPAAPNPEFSAGFDAGLTTSRSLDNRTLEMVSLARALSGLGDHAAMMDNHDEDTHAGCLECQTMMLLSRVVKFGDQLRLADRARKS